MIEIQDAIIAKLKAANPTIDFYAYVEQELAPPYTVVSFPELDENDTDTETGFIADVQIDSFSRYRGMAEIAIVNKAIYDSLHRVTMADTASYCFSTIQQKFSNIVTSGDGLTRVSVQQFTVIFEPS
jgi:hypothetical protein